MIAAALSCILATTISVGVDARPIGDSLFERRVEFRSPAIQSDTARFEALFKRAREELRYAEARKLFDQCIALARKLKDRKREGEAVRSLGVLELSFSHWEEYSRCLRLELEIWRELDYKEGMAAAHFDIGGVCRTRGDLTGALAEYREAQRIYEESGVMVHRGQILLLVGEIYAEAAQFDEAIANFQQAQEIFKQKDPARLMARVLNGMGVVRLAQGRTAESVELHMQALSAPRATHVNVFPLTLNLAAAYFAGKDVENALSTATEALRIARKTKDRLEEAKALKLIARIHQQTGDVAKAKSFLELSFMLCQEAGNRTTEVETMRQLALLSASVGDYAGAHKTIDNAIELGKEIAKVSLLAEAYASKGDIYAASGDAKRASDWYAKADKAFLEASKSEKPKLPTGILESPEANKGVTGSSAEFEVAPGPTKLYPESTRYALLIATDEYVGFDTLSNPVRDAKAIQEVLEAQYGFRTTLLEDPTKDAIFDWYKEFSKIVFKPGDQLVVYITGHGLFESGVFRDGMIVLKESKRRGDASFSTYLSFRDLARLLDNCGVRHVCLLLDVCFGGTFDPRVALQANPNRDAKSGGEVSDAEYVELTLREKTRKVLTSGRDNVVPDGVAGGHSPFAEKLLEAFRAKKPGQLFVSFYDLKSAVRKLTSRPMDADFGSAAASSDFLFVRKGAGALRESLTTDQRSPIPHHRIPSSFPRKVVR